MTRASRGLVGLVGLSLGLTVLAGCRGRREAEPPPLPKRVIVAADPVDERPELPPRWMIDGASVAGQGLPFELERAAIDAGYAAEDIQDYVLADLNGDGARDAVALVVRASGFEALALLSEGERIHALALDPLAARNEAEPWPTYALSVVPLVDGPTLIGLAPRADSCTRGPLWSFVSITGVLLEPVGRLAVEPYDCAAAEASARFVRDPRGQVSRIELRHGEQLSVYVWDPTHSGFEPADP